MAEISKSKIMAGRIEGVFTEVEHHRIAARLKAMSDKWDEIELRTGVRPPEAFDYSFGLLNGRELIFSAVSKDVNTLKAKILEMRWQ